MRMGGFLDSHPDLRFRLLAMGRYKEGRYEDALVYFKRSGRYADKLSQGMVAEMLWQGQGVPRDRALAYAWMDLAAERGYRRLLLLRERYWAELNEAERARALEEGRGIYAEYGDDVAQRRIATVLRRASKRMTGSRLGASAGTRNLQVWIPGPGAVAGTGAGDTNLYIVSGASFYEPKFWEPEQYQAWHDTMWKWSEEQVGRVEVGELENADAPSEGDIE